jgi:hypothetical protein
MPSRFFLLKCISSCGLVGNFYVRNCSTLISKAFSAHSATSLRPLRLKILFFPIKIKILNRRERRDCAEIAEKNLHFPPCYNSLFCRDRTFGSTTAYLLLWS